MAEPQSEWRVVGVKQWRHGCGPCCFCRDLPDSQAEELTGRKFVHAKKCCKCGKRLFSYEPASV